jgi:hypothetical protein
MFSGSNVSCFIVGVIVGVAAGLYFGRRRSCPNYKLSGGLVFMRIEDIEPQTVELNINTTYEVKQVKAGDEENVEATGLDDLELTVQDGSGNIGTVEDSDLDDSASRFITSGEVGAVGTLEGKAFYNDNEVAARVNVTLVESGGVTPENFSLVFTPVESGTGTGTGEGEGTGTGTGEGTGTGTGEGTGGTGTPGG